MCSVQQTDDYYDLSWLHGSPLDWIVNWSAGLECWTGVLDWSAGLECWTGLLVNWITGLDCWTGL